jgi:hypothetical protein
MPVAACSCLAPRLGRAVRLKRSGTSPYEYHLYGHVPHLRPDPLGCVRSRSRGRDVAPSTEPTIFEGLVNRSLTVLMTSLNLTANISTALAKLLRSLPQTCPCGFLCPARCARDGQTRGRRYESTNQEAVPGAEAAGHRRRRAAGAQGLATWRA